MGQKYRIGVEMEGNGQKARLGKVTQNVIKKTKGKDQGENREPTKTSEQIRSGRKGNGQKVWRNK